MSEASVRGRKSEVEEESYFISMSDMLVGLLFVFIILLVYFAVTFKQKEDYLVGAGEARKKLLEQLEKDIEQKLPGVDVVIDTETGILRLPEEVLFESNEYELSDRGQAAIKTVADILEPASLLYEIHRPELHPLRGNGGVAQDRHASC